MDETSREGLVFDIIDEANKPISYITYGLEMFQMI